jgi:tetratricopeptide (TPR) repeat protein
VKVRVIVDRPRLAAVMLVAAAVVSACSAGGEPSRTGREDPQTAAPARAALLPAVLPDLSGVEPAVQAQMKDAFARVLQKQQAAATSDAELGAAYGALGTLLMAAKHYDLAEPCLRNAEALETREPRWPYYLGHLHKAKGMLPQAAAAFTRALALRPGDVPALIWLGEIHLLEGRPAAAAAQFAAAVAAEPRNPAARFGQGRAALAQKDYAGAVAHFEQALALNTNAASIHYPLALAYRGLGETAKAEAHVRQRGDAELLFPDPLMDELRELLRSAVSHEIRGTRALNSGDWRAAAQEFRAGLAADPSNAPMRQKLGTALYMAGDASAAQEAFEELVRRSPDFAAGHYSLGVLLESMGRREEAMGRFSAAVAVDPAYVEARVRLAESLRAAGRLREAVTHYDRALATDPRLHEAALGRAITLVRLGRYLEARERLEEAARARSDPWLAHALARVLAAAPDDRARDGSRALAIMLALPAAEQRLDHGESMAMALAEVGGIRMPPPGSVTRSRPHGSRDAPRRPTR